MTGKKNVREGTQSNGKDTYYLRYMARWRFAIVFLFLSIGTLGMLMFFREQGSFSGPKWGAIVLVFLLFVWYDLAHRLSTASVAITLDDEGIHQVWLRQFAFTSHPNIAVNWTDIVDYKFELEPRNHWFRATLKDGTVWRFHRDFYSFKKDDFVAFKAAFTEQVEQYNRENAANGVQIWRAKTFPETQTAYVLAILICVLIAAFPVVLVILASNDPDAVPLVGIVGAVVFVPAFLFVYLVHLKRKERRQYNKD